LIRDISRCGVLDRVIDVIFRPEDIYATVLLTFVMSSIGRPVPNVKGKLKCFLVFFFGEVELHSMGILPDEFQLFIVIFNEEVLEGVMMLDRDT